jgi:prevent-host-death family protein
MKSWPVQDAKSQFSHVIELAQTEGPQMITRHGKPAVVLVSAKDFQKRERNKENALEFFSRFKGLGPYLRRSKELPRKIDF